MIKDQSRMASMTDDKRKIRVLTADDHPLFRRGVAAMLSDQADMGVVAEAGDGFEAIEQFRATRPDVILMDLRMPGLSGVEAIGVIRGECPSALILVLTTYKGDVEVLRALNAGARGYLLKNGVQQELVEAIRLVKSGHRYLPAEVAAGLASHAIDESLSNREIAVLGLIALGNSNKAIAGQLAITEETVKTHVRNILAKLDAKDRTHAVTIGVRRGIIDT